MSSQPFLAEIMPFAGNFAVRGWAFCDGQLLAISSNTALFSLLGTIYGGDGRTTFALPDLRGRSMVHPGNGPGLDSIRLGQKGGAPTHVLNILEMPQHNHAIGGAPQVFIKTTNDDGDDSEPNGNILAKPQPSTGTVDAYTGDTNSNIGTMAGVTATAGTLATGLVGASQSFSIRSPYLGINHEIALQGIFPSRN